MTIDTIAVIGTGTMGRGIVETAASHGLAVHAAEIDTVQRERAQAAIRKSVEKGIARGKLKANDADEVLGRVRWHADVVEAAVEGQYVVEAIAEDEAAKLELFRRLDGACPPETILASNTSSISITKLAAATGRAERVVGMHFFNPVPIMQPVEIVRGLATSDETVEQTRQLARRMGKEPFTVTDTPGFVVNRVLMPLINEAAFALQEGVADAKTIDSLMKLGCNHPMGPLELADFIGLDVCLSILRVLHGELGDPKFRPCPLLSRMVDAGRLGRKSGRGFHDYNENG
ncbi:MAG: 3-hydroxyacyl-CoA dehydrogenase NAD-binding domain-containing protein [Planctomycetaceae bacterium]